MNNCPVRVPGPRLPWPRRARVAAVITVTAAALLTAACSSSPSSTGGSPNAGSPNAGGSASSQSLLAYSGCVRSHGVPNYPDPGSNGQFDKRKLHLGVSDSQLRAAQDACQSLLPAGTGSLTAQDQQDYLRAAACMRSHGITNFPDPTFSGGHVSFAIPSSIDIHSTQVTQAWLICEKLIPSGLPDSGSGG